MTRDDLKDADILVVRSVTSVGRPLLEGTPVRLVATATAGIDHVDTGYLAERGIEFRHAPGANAESVVEYVLAALFALSVEKAVSLERRSIGIVGYGHVGSRLAQRLRAAGATVLVNDPPLAETVGDFAPDFDVVPLADLVRLSEIVSLHVPLERGGPHPTFQLVNSELLSEMRPGAWLVNTSRGDVVEESALLEHVTRPGAGPAVLDVWTREPHPNPSMVLASRISTPHIAGYGWDGKLAATRAVADAVRTFLGLPATVPAAEEPPALLSGPGEETVPSAWCHAVIRQMYDIEAESARFRTELRASSDPAAAFARFRNEYPRRRSFRRYAIRWSDVPPPCRRVAEVLGLCVVP